MNKMLLIGAMLFALLALPAANAQGVEITLAVLSTQVLGLRIDVDKLKKDNENLVADNAKLKLELEAQIEQLNQENKALSQQVVELAEKVAGLVQDTYEDIVITSAHSQAITGLMSMNSGKELISSSADGSIKKWNLAEDGQQMQTINLNSPISSFEIIEGEKLITGTNYAQSLLVYNASSFELEKEVDLKLQGVYKLAVHPENQNRIYVGSRVQIFHVDLENETVNNTLIGYHSGPVSALAFDDRNQLFSASSYSNKIHVWDTENDTYVKTLSGGHSKQIDDILFDPTTKQIISCSYDGSIGIWNTETLELVKMLTGHSSRVYAVHVWTKQGLLFSASDDKQVKAWNLSNLSERSTLQYEGDSFPVAMITNEQDQLISATYRGDIKVQKLKKLLK